MPIKLQDGNISSHIINHHLIFVCNVGIHIAQSNLKINLYQKELDYALNILGLILVILLKNKFFLVDKKLQKI